MKQVYVNTNQVYINYMPYSEVMMHMRLSGKAMPFRLLDHGSYGQTVQLLDPVITDMPYSSPVLPGEAGLYWDSERKQYYFNQE